MGGNKKICFNIEPDRAPQINSLPLQEPWALVQLSPSCSLPVTHNSQVIRGLRSDSGSWAWCKGRWMVLVAWGVSSFVAFPVTAQNRKGKDSGETVKSLAKLFETQKNVQAQSEFCQQSGQLLFYPKLLTYQPYF